MFNIGLQYPKDDKTDRSGFLKAARLHQSKFRANNLNAPFEKYGNYLTKEDAEKGLNFYNGFGIFDAVKKYRNYNTPLYANMLRSEHIPFNLFIPFDKNKEYCRRVLNAFLDEAIESVDKIEIEYAPTPKGIYLNDGTSFDAYIEYNHVDGRKGILGIEVKYTEREYKLVSNSKEDKDTKNKNSLYFAVSKSCGLYRDCDLTLLITNKFRQVWRNHILGESILQRNPEKFSYFNSLTIFPKGNKHFIEVSEDYTKLLTRNNTFIPITYEDFFTVCQNYCPNSDYQEWLKYLNQRYIVVSQ